MIQHELLQSPRRCQPEAIFRQRMRAGHKMARGQHLWCDHPDERAADVQRKQPELGRIDELPVKQRAHGPWQVERLERHVEPPGKRPYVLILGKYARRDENPVGPDAERDSTLLGCGERSWR